MRLKKRIASSLRVLPVLRTLSTLHTLPRLPILLIPPLHSTLSH